jgi:hypothetical protein
LLFCRAHKLALARLAFQHRLELADRNERDPKDVDEAHHPFGQKGIHFSALGTAARYWRRSSKIVGFFVKSQALGSIEYEGHFWSPFCKIEIG